MKLRPFACGLISLCGLSIVACGGTSTENSSSGGAGGSAETTTNTDTSSQGGTGGAGTSGSGGQNCGDSTSSTGGSNSAACTPYTLSSDKFSIVLAANTPAANIVVANPNVWTHYSAYTIGNGTLDDQPIALALISQMDPNGDAADFTEIALAQNGIVCLSSSAVCIEGNEQRFVLDQVNPDCDLTLLPQTVRTFEVWAKTANVLSGSAAQGAWHGVPRSGHTDALRLTGLVTTTDPTGVIQIGSPSNVNPPSMALRKSRPTVTLMSLSSYTLINSLDQDIFKFQISADAQGSIGWKQVMFSIVKTNDVNLSNFRLRKGAVDMNVADLAITYVSDQGDLTDIKLGAMPKNQLHGSIIISFINEETIAGSGNVYTLHATPSGVVSGQNSTLAFSHDLNASVVTGYLANNILLGGIQASPDIYHLDTGAMPCKATEIGSFVWSDTSETPHDAAIGISGGSRDWTNDAFVQDLTGSKTLSL